jgi:hypothetical protein
VGETAIRFLPHWGPHRTYKKAYVDLFEQISSLRKWQEKRKLVEIYGELEKERRRYLLGQLRNSVLKDNAASFFDWKKPDFSKLPEGEQKRHSAFTTIFSIGAHSSQLNKFGRSTLHSQ